MQVAILLSQLITIFLLTFLCHVLLHKLREINDSMKKNNTEIERVLEIGEVSSKFISRYIEENVQGGMDLKVL